MISDDKPITSAHLPLGIIWTVGVSLVVVTLWLNTSLTELRSDVRALEEWRVNTEGDRFTDNDGQALRTEIMSEIRQERSYSRQLCNELRRLQIELDRIPANDCARP